MDLPQFDALYVISDIHMGGKTDFQILHKTDRLTGFIGWLGLQKGEVALVLNGDVVDTLAEDFFGYVAVNDAVKVIGQIMQRPEFAPIWKALGGFVQEPKHTLVFVLGNHDIELAFPNVQRMIVKQLSGDKAAVAPRIVFSTIGAGFPCRVGNSRVFCTHGNEVDAWNYIRYEDLSKAARRISSGRLLEASEWEPNAGTKLVKDVMNEVKQKYRWIDLLKPETSAAIGVLLILDPGQLSKIDRIWPVAGKVIKGKGEFDQRLSIGRFSSSHIEDVTELPPDALLGPSLTEAIGIGHYLKGDEMLLEAERAFQSGQTIESETDDATLGTGQYLLDRLTGWIRGVGEDEAMRRALKDWLKDDKSFDIRHKDETYEGVMSSIGPDNHFVITGHTHLERAIADGPNYFYFNTGTWIRLLRFTEKILENKKSFKKAYEVLMDGSMDAIDNAARQSNGFVLDHTSAVSICRDNKGGTVGTLLHVTGDGTTFETVGGPFRRK